MIIHIAKLNQFHINKTIDNHSHLNKKDISLGLLFTKQWRNGHGEKRNSKQNYGQNGKGFETKIGMNSWYMPSLSSEQWNMFTCSTMSCRDIKNTMGISDKWVRRNTNRPTNKSTNNHDLEIKAARVARSITIPFSSIHTGDDGLLSSAGARFNQLIQFPHGMNE